MESETIKTGNYYIEREGENIKITLIDTNVTLYNSQDLSELLNYSAIALYLNK